MLPSEASRTCHGAMRRPKASAAEVTWLAATQCNEIHPKGSGEVVQCRTIRFEVHPTPAPGVPLLTPDRWEEAGKSLRHKVWFGRHANHLVDSVEADFKTPHQYNLALDREPLKVPMVPAIRSAASEQP